MYKFFLYPVLGKIKVTSWPISDKDSQSFAVWRLLAFLEGDAEFDELNIPSRRGFERVTEINQILINNNYQLIKTDGKADFLYLKN